MIDILFLAIDDWANTGWRFFKCAQMLGLKAMGFKGVSHPFHYPEQLVVHPELVRQNSIPIMTLGEGNELSNFVRHSSIIHFIASSCIFTGVNLDDKAVVMQHGGRAYRTRHESMNELYNQFCDAAIIQCPDLLGFGAKNEKLIFYPVDTNFIRPSFDRAGKKLVIGHFPSQPLEKGADAVVKVMDRLREVTDKFEFRQADSQIIWLDGLSRMRDCDLIIDVFSAKTIAGLDYGTWGNASIEAAALGRVVVTMSLHEDVYKEEYGDCALQVANTEDELLETLLRFTEMSDDELLAEKMKTRQWVEEKHSMEATAMRLLPVYQGVAK